MSSFSEGNYILNIVGQNTYVGNDGEHGLFGSSATNCLIGLSLLYIPDSSLNTMHPTVLNWVNGQYTSSAQYLTNNSTFGICATQTGTGIALIPYDVTPLGHGQYTLKFQVNNTGTFVTNNSTFGLCVTENASIATEFHLIPAINS
jgi:hypothetical protein